ncbi:general secretion pathway protein GspK [Marinobacterium sedimentorum]|uniref:general secretion pathway protein GspK n=1 Tax=Marinobacterium sedimentorum TaxID=2927804 RepID=UPI0020C66B18|nr:type II secretion system protein GspK [Marinobacterium sedimentorum]MCP8687240.1 general secretion pathway protein GspK [Marinobacterium sedimentorum]
MAAKPCCNQSGPVWAGSYQRGLALVAVLWVLVLLSLLAANLSQGSRSNAQLAQNLVAATQGKYASEAGMQWALWNLQQPPEERWLADGSVQLLLLDDIPVRVALQDESGKIDLNAAPVELLGGLFLAAELDNATADALADAIMDWRDDDDLRRLNGAEDDDYLAAGREYGAKDAAFERVEELQRVLGMTADIYRRVKGSLTVFNGLPAINPLYAPRLALLALPGADEGTVEQYIEQRRRNRVDGLEAPEPPLPESPYLSVGREGANYTVLAEAEVGPVVRARFSAQIQRRGRSAQGLSRIQRETEPLFEEDGM